MFLDLLVSPVGRQPDSSRVQDVFADGEFRQHNVILGHVADDLFVLLQVAWHSIDLRRSAGAGLLAHQNIDKCRLAGAGSPHDTPKRSSIDLAGHVG